jgi:hypothetical protein
LSAVVEMLHLVAGKRQVVGKHPRQGEIVLDDQDPLFHLSIVSLRS